MCKTVKVLSVCINSDGDDGDDGDLSETRAGCCCSSRLTFDL